MEFNINYLRNWSKIILSKNLQVLMQMKYALSPYKTCILQSEKTVIRVLKVIAIVFLQLGSYLGISAIIQSILGQSPCNIEKQNM